MSKMQDIGTPHSIIIWKQCKINPDQRFTMSNLCFTKFGHQAKNSRESCSTLIISILFPSGDKGLLASRDVQHHCHDHDIYPYSNFQIASSHCSAYDCSISDYVSCNLEDLVRLFKASELSISWFFVTIP